MTKSEGEHPFVECATFADEIKGRGMYWQAGWHFVDQPYLDDGGTVDDYPNFDFDMHNVKRAIPAPVDWITEQGDYKQTFVY